MKKIACLFISLLMLFRVCGSLCYAKDNAYSAADALYSLGLFKGTAEGYELERTPTRAETLTMLIRFLGLEKKALSSNFSAPFTDISGWYKPYISYAYSKGLTNGVGNNMFAPNKSASFNEYAIMLLRALGYSTSYTGNIEKAKDTGIFDYVSENKSMFTRGDMVLMSYGALFAVNSDSGKNLLQEMLGDGIISSENLKKADFSSVKPIKESSGTENVLEPLLFVSADGTELSIGMTAAEISALLGTPSRIDPSLYGFSWYVYNSDYSDFIMVGMENGKSCAFYSNSCGTSCGEATVGKTMNDEPPEFSNAVLTVFLDGIDNDVGSLLAAPRALTVSEDITDEIITAMERELLDISNAERTSAGLQIMSWSNAASECAEAHSTDMSNKNYFSHTSIDGRSSLDRLTEHGVFYSSCAENIAQGYRTVFSVHHAWMNSEGHRAAILQEDFRYFGAGITSDYYYTECFYTP